MCSKRFHWTKRLLPTLHDQLELTPNWLSKGRSSERSVAKPLLFRGLRPPISAPRGPKACNLGPRSLLDAELPPWPLSMAPRSWTNRSSAKELRQRHLSEECLRAHMPTGTWEGAWLAACKAKFVPWEPSPPSQTFPSVTPRVAFPRRLQDPSCAKLLLSLNETTWLSSEEKPKRPTLLLSGLLCPRLHRGQKDPSGPSPPTTLSATLTSTRPQIR